MSYWQVGDRAVCIKDGPWVFLTSMQPSPGPAKGQVSRVTGVSVYGDMVTLNLEGYQNRFVARRFRKIHPCAPKFKEMLKGLKPKVMHDLELKDALGL